MSRKGRRKRTSQFGDESLPGRGRELSDDWTHADFFREVIRRERTPRPEDEKCRVQSQLWSRFAVIEHQRCAVAILELKRARRLEDAAHRLQHGQIGRFLIHDTVG